MVKPELHKETEFSRNGQASNELNRKHCCMNGRKNGDFLVRKPTCRVELAQIDFSSILIIYVLYMSKYVHLIYKDHVLLVHRRET